MNTNTNVGNGHGKNVQNVWKTATFCTTTRCSFPYVLYMHVCFFHTHSLHDPQFCTFCTCMYVFSICEFSIGNTPNYRCCPNSNEHSEFMRVIYDPSIMLDAHWTEKQVQRSDLHLGCTN
jgi:hypothetical protein